MLLDRLRIRAALPRARGMILFKTTPLSTRISWIVSISGLATPWFRALAIALSISLTKGDEALFVANLS
jgi:hypothetical protein